jgi:hypothetical protein
MQKAYDYIIVGGGRPHRSLQAGFLREAAIMSFRVRAAGHVLVVP